MTFSFCSFYSYDPSGRYLTSVNRGDVTLEYTYSEDGDLIRATDEYGASKIISYNQNNWIESIENFDSNSELASKTNYNISWNGKLDIFVSPINTSQSIVHDKNGNIVSIATDNGLPGIIVESPYGRRLVLGDEVSLTQVSYRYIIACNEIVLY